MSALEELPESHRRLLARVNRVLLWRARSLLSPHLRGGRFRALVHAEEGVEAAGLETFEPHEPAERMDLARLAVPWPLLPLALLNQDVLARRYEPSVENDFVLVLDLSRSMRFPLRRLYAGRPLGGLTAEDFERGKPARLKQVAAAFLEAAAASGFRVRVVTFGAHGFDPGVPLRRPSAQADLFDRIDRHFAEVSARPRLEADQYDRVAARLLQDKGVFFFAGDFLDADPASDDPGRLRRWYRTLELFEAWGRRRPLLVARINHSQEVMPPQAVGPGSQGNPWGDCCHLPVETNSKYLVEDHLAAFREGDKNARRRLTRQQAWAAELMRSLRSACRGLLAVDNNSDEHALKREANRMWTRLTER